MFYVTFLKETYFTCCKICASLTTIEYIWSGGDSETKAISKKRGRFCFINTETPSTMHGYGTLTEKWKFL